MKKIICYTNRLPEGAKQNITFMELLLDERWANGNAICPKEIFNAIGNINHKLAAKQNYEFLLRAAQKYPLTAVGSSLLPDSPAPMESSDTMIIDNGCQRSEPWDSYRTDCYIVGKYQQELLSSGYFNPVIEALLKDASQLPNPKEATGWLEKMISHAPEYFEIDDDTRPILIYRSSDTCYNTLNLFADELAKALRACHQRVDVFDIEKEGNQSLTQFIGCRFKAVIGIQTYAFSIMMQDKKTNLHDLIIGPKYNMLLDHPAMMKEHIENGPEDYRLLIHDRNYLSFAKRHYKRIKNCIYFPPGGMLPTDASKKEKQYGLTFIGSYNDYRKRLAIIRSYDRPHRFLAARFLHIMRQNPDCPAELAFQEALKYYNVRLSDAGFLHLFYEMRQVCFCIMTYYREKIIRTLLDAEITIHVYSDSWKNSPFAEHKGLVCHPAINAEENLKIMERSKISLNIMSWHKDGLTERVLNAMLCRSVVLSDKSAALKDSFVDGQDLVLFSLKQLDSLPVLVKELLEDEKRLQEIAENGYGKARQKHLWLHRAKLFLECL